MSIRRFGLLLGVGAVMALVLPASTPVQAQSAAKGSVAPRHRRQRRSPRERRPARRGAIPI